MNQITVNGKKLITIEAAAVELGVSYSTVRRLISAGELARVRVLGRWLIDCTSLEKARDRLA